MQQDVLCLLPQNKLLMVVFFHLSWIGILGLERSLAQICLCSQVRVQLVALTDCKGRRTQIAIHQWHSAPAPSPPLSQALLRFWHCHQLHLAHQIKLILCPNAGVRKGRSTHKTKLIYCKCGVVGRTCEYKKIKALKIPRGRKRMAWRAEW